MWETKELLSSGILQAPSIRAGSYFLSENHIPDVSFAYTFVTFLSYSIYEKYILKLQFMLFQTFYPFPKIQSS